MEVAAREKRDEWLACGLEDVHGGRRCGLLRAEEVLFRDYFNESLSIAKSLGVASLLKIAKTDMLR